MYDVHPVDEKGERRGTGGWLGGWVGYLSNKACWGLSFRNDPSFSIDIFFGVSSEWRKDVKTSASLFLFLLQIVARRFNGSRPAYHAVRIRMKQAVFTTLLDLWRESHR